MLEAAGCDSTVFDASCMIEKLAGVSRGGLLLRSGDIAPRDLIEAVEAAAKQRAAGRPLQYILGEWDFLSLTLEVGEGVLIPRADTELLCETAAGRLEGVEAPRVLDLCAGSGCVGLGIASLCKGAAVTAVELSGQAFGYLKRNCTRYPGLNVLPVKADVLKDFDQFGGGYDAILSNPPYIPTGDLPLLMREVKWEPAMALDGGDGLVFYRMIADHWLDRLKEGGFCAVEVGIGQAEAVMEIFAGAGLRGVEVFRDLNRIKRVVIGGK